MFYTIRRHRSRMWLAAVLALGIGALALVTVLAVSPGSMLRLAQGMQADAPRPTEHGDADHRHPEADAPQPVAAHASAAALPANGLSPLTAEDVVAAFDCARDKARLPTYERDAELDREAAILLQHFQHKGEAHLEPGENGYTLTGQLLLDSAATAAPPRGCEVGGFDVTQVPDLDRSHRIGVALAPVPNPYDRPLYHAIVIGR